MDLMAAFTGLSFAKSVLQTMLATKVEIESQGQILAALEKVGAAQDAMFQMREDLFRLQAENEAVRRDLAARDSWEAQKAPYKLEKTQGGAIVYVSGSPAAFRLPGVLFEGRHPDPSGPARRERRFQVSELRDGLLGEPIAGF